MCGDFWSVNAECYYHFDDGDDDNRASPGSECLAKRCRYAYVPYEYPGAVKRFPARVQRVLWLSMKRRLAESISQSRKARVPVFFDQQARPMREFGAGY